MRGRERVVERSARSTWRTSGFAESARMPSPRVPFQAVSAASAWYSPSISTSPRTWRGSGFAGITSIPPP